MLTDLTRVALAVAALALCLGAAPKPSPPPGVKELPPAEKLPSVKELPDPFLMNDGSRVKTKQDWQRRREELKAAILYYQYGHLPPAPGNVEATELSSKVNGATKATEKELLLKMGPGGRVSTHVKLTIPEGKGPFPAVVSGDLAWDRVTDEMRAEFARRGYVLAVFNREEIVPDKNEKTTGLYAAYPEYDPSALAAWAWGFHRVVDYLLTQPYVDKERIAATGHSRGGKTALLAGATDERIALTVPNNSGAGGAGCYRFQAPKSEDIAAITGHFPHWFQPRFAEFVGQVDRIPFDQHSLKALVAPRALLSTEALGDLWANPEGTQQSHLAAKEVFKFLGAEEKIGIHFREGEHEQNLEDWQTLLDFADKVFFGKKPDRDFGELAFPNSPKAFSWSAPAESK